MSVMIIAPIVFPGSGKEGARRGDSPLHADRRVFAEGRNAGCEYCYRGRGRDWTLRWQGSLRYWNLYWCVCVCMWVLCLLSVALRLFLESFCLSACLGGWLAGCVCLSCLVSSLGFFSSWNIIQVGPVRLSSVCLSGWLAGCVFGRLYIFIYILYFYIVIGFRCLCEYKV